MSIAWNQFTPWSSLVGGLLVGCAVALYLLGNGRIAGIAGIVASPWRALITGRSLRADNTRLFFIAGLLVAPWVWQIVAPLPAARSVTGTAGLVIAGLLVGVGTRMGNGCTSGHGVCGLSRFSGRSLANVLAFMGAGVATVFVIKQVLA